MGGAYHDVIVYGTVIQAFTRFRGHEKANMTNIPGVAFVLITFNDSAQSCTASHTL